MNEQANKNIELLYNYLETRDRNAYLELFEYNMNLVKFVIRKTVNFKNDYQLSSLYDDLLQVGYIGLHKAIINFDLDKVEKFAFSTYAAKCIKYAICIEIRRQKRHKYIYFNDEAFKSPDVEDTDLLKFDLCCENEKKKIEDIIEYDGDLENIIEYDYYKYKKNRISRAFKNLSDKERKIVELYYGFNGEEPLKQIEIATLFNVSVAYVSKIIISINNYLCEQLKEFEKEYTIGEDKNKPKRKTDYVLSINLTRNVKRKNNL